ncbi:MAG: hydrogenase maturation protease [Candidatus Tectomicrobia bacterium]|uniref:Hydrogenase maturation protease n=1 Tax=Tectimicrobiota bacterium TaxID=2528274 RepID=A0A933GLF1_UNCTE|nr:hydrogenase maturation protease [Candidatus Tectomicrobia bacterium]
MIHCIGSSKRGDYKISRQKERILLLALGNDILGDDGVGLVAARLLRNEFFEAVVIVESGEAGLALLEIMAGYGKALLLDAIVTGKYPPGTVAEFRPEDFKRVMAPSPHYAGIPEVLDLAERMKIPFPQEIRILALEVEKVDEIHEGLSSTVEQALPGFIEIAGEILRGWLGKSVGRERKSQNSNS